MQPRIKGRIVHYNGKVYDIGRLSPSRHIRTIWVWQGTYDGTGHKRTKWHN